MKYPPRLRIGAMLIGPNFYGCVNTGLEPTLLHSRLLKKYPTLNRGFRFAIGPRLFVEDAVMKLLTRQVPAGQSFVEFDKRKYAVTFARTYEAARRRMNSLIAEVEAENEKQRRRHERLLKRAARMDVKAIAQLADYQ